MRHTRTAPGQSDPRVAVGHRSPLISWWCAVRSGGAELPHALDEVEPVPVTRERRPDTAARARPRATMSLTPVGRAIARSARFSNEPLRLIVSGEETFLGNSRHDGEVSCGLPARSSLPTVASCFSAARLVPLAASFSCGALLPLYLAWRAWALFWRAPLPPTTGKASRFAGLFRVRCRAQRGRGERQLPRRSSPKMKFCALPRREGGGSGAADEFSVDPVTRT